MNFDIKVKKILERIYQPPPFSSNSDELQPQPDDDSPMGATAHHYGPPKPDLSDISPETLQLLQLFSSQSGKPPADPDQHDGIKLFRQWPEQIQDLVISDLMDLANQAPNPELKVSLTNMEKFLKLMRGDHGNV